MDTVTQQEAMELVKTYGTQAAAAAFLNMSKSAFGRLLHTGSTSGKNYSANKQDMYVKYSIGKGFDKFRSEII